MRVSGDRLSAGPITIDPARHEVLVNGKPVELTSLEFKLLRTLIQRRGCVQERDRLLNEVWGYESVIDTRTVDTHVRRLRQKLGQAGTSLKPCADLVIAYARNDALVFRRSEFDFHF